MEFEKMAGHLTDLEKQALEILEKSGWEVLIGAKIEDTYLKTGARRRTFRREGRHNLAITCRRVDDPRRKFVSNRLDTHTAILREEAELEADTLKQANEKLEKDLKEAEGKIKMLEESLAKTVKDVPEPAAQTAEPKSDKKKRKPAKKSG